MISETPYALELYDFKHPNWCKTDYTPPAIVTTEDPTIDYPEGFFCGLDYGTGVRTVTLNPPIFTDPACDYADRITWAVLSYYNDETVMQFIKVFLNPETYEITVEAKAGGAALGGT